ncbi:MAG: FtsX-like permease family protein [Pseudomonadota bacterium]
MKLHDIALNNLKRRKGKAFFIVMGLMLGISSIVALMTTARIMAEDIEHKMDEFGANIILTPKTEGLSLSYGGLSLGGVSFDQKELHEADLEKIKTIKNAANIKTISSKLFGVFENGPQKALFVGVDFPSETAIKKWWKVTGKVPELESEVLAGTEAAKRFGLNPGSVVEIKERRLRVSGILQTTGSQDDDLFFVDLSVAQELLGKEGKVAMVEVAAHCQNCPISDLVTQISEILPAAKVTAVQQVVEGRMETLAGFQKMSVGISAMILLVGSMVVFVTMMAGVNERTREIGIFSAIGFRRSHIMRIILLEALIVSLTAGVLGYAAGLLATRVLLGFLMDKIAHFTLDPLVAVGAVVLAVVLGLLASFYPAMVAARMEPSEALRTL